MNINLLPREQFSAKYLSVLIILLIGTVFIGFVWLGSAYYTAQSEIDQIEINLQNTRLQINTANARLQPDELQKQYLVYIEDVKKYRMISREWTLLLDAISHPLPELARITDLAKASGQGMVSISAEFLRLEDVAQYIESLYGTEFITNVMLISSAKQAGPFGSEISGELYKVSLTILFDETGITRQVRS